MTKSWRDHKYDCFDNATLICKHNLISSPVDKDGKFVIAFRNALYKAFKIIESKVWNKNERE